MSYGTLTVVCGPMYAGKTTEILKTILWARNGEGLKVLVIKPAFDTRYAINDVVSHDGLRSPALAIGAWDDLFLTENDPANYDVICLDEVQFFTEPHFSGDIVAIVTGLLADGKKVVANGLDMNWKGEPFQTTALLMAMADSVLKKSAHCTVCGQPAPKTFKKVAEGGSVELGASELYEARCNAHWK